MTFCFVESLPKSVTFLRKASLLASCRCYLVEIMLLVPLWQSWWLSGGSKKGLSVVLFERKLDGVLFLRWGYRKLIVVIF